MTCTAQKLSNVLFEYETYGIIFYCAIDSLSQAVLSVGKTRETNQQLFGMLPKMCRENL